MKYEKFEKWMVGQRVFDMEDKDYGIVQSDRYSPWSGRNFEKDEILVLWTSGTHTGEKMWIRLHNVSFVDKEVNNEALNVDEIFVTIGNKQYKLVEVK